MKTLSWCWFCPACGTPVELPGDLCDDCAPIPMPVGAP